MEMASFDNFLRTLVYIIAFYYIFKYVVRLLFPILVKKAVNHAQENMRQQFNQYQNTANDGSKYSQKGPDVTVDTSNAARPRETKKVGEYIDYEEIN